MEPQLPTWHDRATLVDLLDRVLDRGLFLRADLVVCMAGIPLIGVSLSAALAGTETMLKYGFPADWDQAIRAEAPAPQSSGSDGRSLPSDRPRPKSHAPLTVPT